jgi:methylitaconate Delta-isomerase
MSETTATESFERWLVRTGNAERGDQIGVPCVFMRGGTSRGVVIRREHLPSDERLLSAIVCSIYGSPDIRQINGLGGGTGQTSKVCIVSAPSRPEVDIEYTFGQVRVDEPVVDFSGNCGNMASAVAAYAVDGGFVKIPNGAVECEVRIHMTNTDQMVYARVPLVGGVAGTVGRHRVDGVPGTGAPIYMDLRDTVGSLGAGALPLGAPRSEVVVPGGRRYEVSMVDVGNAAIFVRAADLGMRGTELPAEMTEEIIAQMLAIRAEIAYQLGRCSSPDDAQRQTPATPKIYAVAPPADYVTLGGRHVAAHEISLCSRGLLMGRPHQSHAATVAVCAAVAAQIPGTLVREAASSRDSAGQLSIGHPGGVTTVSSAISGTGADLTVEHASLVLTARRLMDGYAYASSEVAAPNGRLAPSASVPN